MPLDLEDNAGILTADKFDPIFDRTINLEGGFTVDSGGPTNLGITQDTYNRYRSSKGLPPFSIKQITPPEAKDIAKTEYFESPKINTLPDRVASVVFDHGFNAGPMKAITTLQSTVGAKPDGVIGPKTQAAVNSFIQKNGEDELIKKLLKTRENQYRNLATKNPQKYQKYLPGWLNRIQKIKNDLDLSMLNPFAVKDASAEEGPLLDLEDTAGILSDKPWLPEEKPLPQTLDLEDTAGILRETLSPEQPPNWIAEGLKQSAIQLGQHPIKTILEAGERIPRAIAMLSEQVQQGKEIKPFKEDSRDSTQIFQDVMDGAIKPPSEVKPDNFLSYWGTVGREFLKYLPGTTAGVAAEIYTNPVSVLSFGALGKIIRIPAVAKVLGKEFSGPQWFEDAIDSTIKGFHQPFQKTAEEVSEIRINQITDELYKKFEPNMDELRQNYQNIYKMEPTPNDIKGLIKAKLVKAGIYDKPIQELNNALKKAKTEGVKLPTEPVEVKPNEQIMLREKTETGFKETPIKQVETPQGEIIVPPKQPVSTITPPSSTTPTLETVQPGASQGPENFKTAEEYVASKGNPSYHGTNVEFNMFDNSKTGGVGFYFTKNKVDAERYGKNIKEVYLDIKNPAPKEAVDIAYKNATGGNPRKMAHEQLISQGYDGIIRPGETIVFKPEQIKTKSQLTAEWQAAQKGMTQSKAKQETSFTMEDTKDLENMIDWESSQQKGETYSFINAEGQREVGGSPTAHSKTMSEIGPKESFKLLNKAKAGEKLTPLQLEKVKLLLEDYRDNIKEHLEAAKKEIENVRPELPETPSAEEIHQAVEKESQVTEYDWDGNPTGPKEVKQKTPQDFIDQAKNQSELFQADLSKEEKVGEQTQTGLFKKTVSAHEESQIRDFGEKIGGARKDIADRGYTKGTIKKETTNEPSWKSKYITAEKVDKSGWTVIKKDLPYWAIRERGQVFSTKEEAEKAIPVYAVSQSHRVYANKEGKWEIFKKVGERKLFKVVNQSFPSREEAMKYMATNAENILNLKTSFGEEILPIPEIAIRKGIERRERNADATMFMKTFAPRGIEFGNWNNQEERQQVLNHAYDGLLDLADALGVSPKDLMMNGELGIAFGARGHGLVGAKAHYENDYGVINLTKMKGAGSLAHEWFHALDNYLAKIDGKAKSERIKNSRGDLVFPVKSTSDVMLSFGSSYQSKLDKDLLASYKTLIDSMFRKAEQYVESTEIADKFLAKAREEVKNKLDGIRLYISKPYEYARIEKFKKPANAEQLAEFDRLADSIIEGGNLETKFREIPGSKNMFKGRDTNDALEGISAILKSVRGRAGFGSQEMPGTLDNLRAAMGLYKARLQMFTEAENKIEKTKSVPTNYAIEAKKMDQARVGEYWSQPNEMAARAFAAYIEDKIAQSGGQSDFIVYHAHGGVILPMIDGFVARPYPEGTERKALKQEFDKFIDKLRSILKRNDEILKNNTGSVTLSSALSKFADLISSPEQREGIYQKVVNRFQSIENTVIKAKKLGAKIQPGEDAGLSATKYLSIANQADITLKRGTYVMNPSGNIEITGEGLKPILDSYDDGSIEKDAFVREKDLKDYLIAKRTIEDLQRPKSEFSEKNIASPEQVATQEKRLSELKDKYGDMRVFEDTAKRIYDYQKRVLHLLVDSGNMSQKQFDDILSKNPNYVPFDRIISEETSSVIPTSKNRFSGARSPIKKIKGSELEIHDPIGSMIKNTYRIMNVASRNKVFKDIYSLKDIEGLGITQAKIQMRPVNVTEEETGGEELTIFRPSQFKPKGNVLEGFIDGKRKYLEVSENLYKAMTGLDETSSSIMVKLLSKPAQWLRTGATITPEFILRNPIRDQWTALIQTNLGWKPFIDTTRAIADILKETETYDEWIRSGGSYSGFVELSRPNIKNLVKELRKNPSLLRKLNIVTRLQDMSQLFEQATRVGVFKAGIKKGMSAIEAAKASREATLDFSRRGSATRDINSMIAFFNAGIQGLDKSLRIAKADPAGFFWKGVISITIPSLLLYLKNREEDDYAEIPQWQKDLFWLVKVNGIWFRIPKPFSYGQIFGSLPERMMSYIDKKNPDAFKNFGKSLYESLSPITGDPMSGLLPTAIRPLLENQVNWSFFRQRPIVSIGQQRFIPSEQYSKYDTETAKMLGRLTNVSPSKIENLISGYFGGSGRYVLEGGDLVLKGADKITGVKREAKRPTELSDIILLKGFVTRESQSESVNTFYENKDKIDKLQATYKDFKKNGQITRAENLLKSNPELTKYKVFQAAYKRITGLNDMIDRIIANRELSNAEKRLKLKELNNLKINISRKVNSLLR